MISAVFSAIVILGQAAPAAAPVADAPPAAKGKADSVVSGVTVNGKTLMKPQIEARTLVCHDEAVLGTLFPKRVCITQEAQNERRREDQEVTRDFQRSVIAGPQPM